jgi:hypothetical protein
MAIEELYISIDIEADGRAPGLSSMLSLGAAAFTLDKIMHGHFSCNFELLDGAKAEPAVAEFWDKHPSAYQETRKNLLSPEKGTDAFVAWLNATAGNRKPIFVGYPAAYDFKWVDYYTVRFTGNNPFGHSGCIDIKSYVWAKLGGKFSHVTKRNFPKRWFDPMPHTHVALDDAIEQGRMFVNIVREIRGLPPIL